MPGEVRASRSFEPDDRRTVTLDTGQIAHAAHIAQSARLERRLVTVCPGVWCLVGNGLSNQTFIDGPDGIVAIDTGESVEEMTAALAELRTVTDRPVVAVLYTHFPLRRRHPRRLDACRRPHRRRVRPRPHRRQPRPAATEIAPAYRRGLVEQFALALPDDGPDGLVNVGLGRNFRDPSHAPFTQGYVTADTTFDQACTITAAGLTIEVTPAPSDADDSVTYWFASLGVAVNNIVWPALFNVFAIRGEEYRDPRIPARRPRPPAVAPRRPSRRRPRPAHQRHRRNRAPGHPSRDAIAFLWDQTVRHTNLGATSAELAHRVRLPDHCDDDPITSELYGIAEHHTRQIRSGLFGFFDGDIANLFPLATADRANRMIAGFGGRAAVRSQADDAIANDDLRWALELASWLVHSDDADDNDRSIAARALRTVARRTSAANIRSWCLTRARQLDGTLDAGRDRTHRLHPRAVAADPVASVAILRVMVDPAAADGIDTRLRFDFGDAGTTGLHIRNSIAAPGDATDADATIAADPADWAAVVAGGAALSEVVASGAITIGGDTAAAITALGCFDRTGLRS